MKAIFLLAAAMAALSGAAKLTAGQTPGGHGSGAAAKRHAKAAEPPEAVALAGRVMASSVHVLVGPALAAGAEPELVTKVGAHDLDDLAAAESHEHFVGQLWPDARHVMVRDFCVAERALGPVLVRRGDAAATGRIERIYRREPYALLALDHPVGGKALKLSGGRPEFGAMAVERNDRTDGAFAATAGELSESGFAEDGTALSGEDMRGAVLFDGRGRPCGFFDAPAHRPMDRLEGDPARWESWTPEGWQAAADHAAASARAGLAAVTFRFHAPRPRKFGEEPAASDTVGDDAGGLELRTVGVWVSPTRLAVNLPGKDRERLSRLEGVDVWAAGAKEPQKGRFIAALGCAAVAVVEADRPAGAPAVSARPVDSALGEALVVVSAAPDGATGLRLRTGRARVEDLRRDWRDLVVADDALGLPDFEKEEDEPGCVLVFDAAGGWLWRGLRIYGRNVKTGVAAGDANGWGYVRAADFARLTAEPAPGDIDLAARPAGGEAVRGTLGFDVQAMDRDLAELLHVTRETDGGTFGALVTSVDTAGAAARAGVTNGWVLLSLKPAGGAPQRLELEGDGSEEDSTRSRYWDAEGGEDATGEYYGWTIPWHTRSTAFTAALTKLGVGRKVDVAFLADGRLVTRTMTVEQAAPDYLSSPAWKWTAGGISVCDLTDDVRETLALDDDAPGVVVCGYENGSRAVVAGLRPYEIITMADGKPIRSTADFRKAVTGKNRVRLNVLRLTTTRTVNIEY